MEVKIKHPIFGHVIFTSPTNRQIEILEHYNKLIKERGDGDKRISKDN